MKNSIIIFCFIILNFSHFSAMGQGDSIKYFGKENFIFLNVSPAIVGDIWNINTKWLVLGYEKGFKNKFSGSVSLGYAFHFPENKNSILSMLFVQNSKGFDISPEIKKHIKNNTYAGIQFYFQKTITSRTQNVLNYVTYTPYETLHYKDIDYTVNRIVLSINIKFGGKHVFRNGFTIDNSLGLGLKYIRSYSSGKQSFQTIDYEIPYNKPFDDGRAFFPSLLYHLKIGYSFTKSKNVLPIVK